MKIELTKSEVEDLKDVLNVVTSYKKIIEILCASGVDEENLSKLNEKIDNCDKITLDIDENKF